MFMRLVNLKVKEGRMNDFARAYEDRIIPALQGVKGWARSQTVARGVLRVTAPRPVSAWRPVPKP